MKKETTIKKSLCFVILFFTLLLQGQVTQTFGVNLITPTDNQSFEEGITVQLFATATTDVGAITRVDFQINNEVVSSVTTLPYYYNWIPQTPGSYTVQAVAYNDSDAQVSSTLINVVITAVDKTNLTGKIYRLRNVETGQYLQAQITSTSPVLMNNSSDGQDKEWVFIKTTVNNITYSNIDSQINGVLRATGSSYTSPNAVFNTTKAPPTTDSDKIWTVHYIQSDDTYRFEAGSGGRFLYVDPSGTVISSNVPDTDARSKWQVISLPTTPPPPPTPTPTYNFTLAHPHIWVKDAEKQAILDKIAQNTWATNLFNQYKSRVDSKKNSHKTDPSTIINTIPGFPGTYSTHINILTLGYESALLYWLTGDEDYAQLAADILHHYTKTIAQISGNVDFQSGSSDSYLIDSRGAYTKPPMIYDFVHTFLNKSGSTVYDLETGTRVPFNFTNSETTFKKLADNVFNRGGINSNHPVLEAPGALFNVLSIEDDATRQTYFNKFMNGTPNQNGLTWMMNECKESGVWPEATGYSVGPQRIISELMEVVDRYNPSLNIIDNNKEILEESFFFENYRFPNNKEVMRMGDAHRTSLNAEDLTERVFAISKRKGYTNLESKSRELLKAYYSNKGGFNPTVTTQTLEWNNPLDLLWMSNIELTNVTPIAYNSSINIDYAGVAMQRNINTSDRVESGLMGYTGGAHYVHSHLSGIDMEIYGLGAVMGTGGGDVGAGNNARDGEEFRNYHRIYAGHNTVIVNGKSKGQGSGSWKSDNQLFMNTTKTVAAEPISLAQPVSDNFSFSSQVLDDVVNNAKQQRVLSIIRTSDNSGYYFDLFRSKSLGTNDFHDYVYHNVGDGVSMVDSNNNPIQLTPTTGRYQSIESVYGGKSIFFPGWHYFEQVNTSAPTTSFVKATIPMTKQGVRYMHILMPGGENREYTACKGPATIEGQMGYEGIKTPIVTVRQPGEAWNKPFVSIFEPSRNTSGTVQSVDNLYTADKIVGAKVISKINDTTITDYIISNENDGEIFSLNSPSISFTGRFGIIRIEDKKGNDKKEVSLYIGKGNEITYEGQTLSADGDGKGILKYTTEATPFTLPSNNFKVQLNGETCVGKNNGNIVIEAQASNSYEAKINGKTYLFTNKVTIDNVTPGTYDLCISVVGESYEQCFKVVIAGGVSLTGKITVVKGDTAYVSIDQGTAPFTVLKNGQTILETYQSDFSLQVNDGDDLKITSKTACQGEISKKIDLLEDLMVYPNPSNGIYEIILPMSLQSVDLAIYDVKSQLMLSKNYKIEAGKLSLDISSFPNGVYFVKLNLAKPSFIKLIKN